MNSRIEMGPAWRKDVGGLRMVKVAGSFREMGRQHGALLKEEVRQGPVPYFRRFVEKMMGGKGMGKVAWLALQRGIGVNVERALPSFAVETVRGMAEGAGMDFRDLMSGCTMPDTLMWIVARMMHVRRVGPAVAHRHALGLGCTSAVAWGNATKDGMLLHARNFDYYGVSVWPKTQAVVFHQPEKGNRYVSVTAAGVPLGGVTAMNEAGLTLTVHQHMFTDKTRFGGIPIGTVGDIVMREAKNLDDAERILGSHTPIGCWTYLITDGNAREVLCWEENPQRKAPLRVKDAGTFGYANIYLDNELGKTEHNLYGNYWRHNMGRHRAVGDRLRENFGSLDPHGMAKILGDTGKTECRVRDSIAMMLTVASVVFRPEDGSLWVGSGDTPTSHGTFVPFSLRKEDHAPELGTFTGGQSDAAYDHYRKAYLAYVDEGDAHVALAEMDRARQLAPEQPVYHAIFGLLAMSLGDAKAAEPAFEKAIALGHPDPERLASMHLWRGRAHDLEGRRAEALGEYERALALRADPPVRKAAEKGARKPYRGSNLHVEMTFGDVVSP